jgi:hypothetical protein
LIGSHIFKGCATRACRIEALANTTDERQEIISPISVFGAHAFVHKPRATATTNRITRFEKI